MFLSLPYNGYRDLEPWFEEFCDAVGLRWQTWKERFVSATARANMLDPSRTPTELPGEDIATATEPPTSEPDVDTMLDLMCFVAGIPTPVDSNLTVAQKQALVSIGWDALRRKGTRRQLLRLAAALGDDVAFGLTGAEYNFSLIFGDNWPSPGFGAWCPLAVTQTGTVSTTSASATVTGAGTAFSSEWIGKRIQIGSTLSGLVQAVGGATTLTLSANADQTLAGQAFSIVPDANERPWLFQATRQVTANAFPAWATQGVGYTQFRAGFSAAGEPVLASGATLCLATNPHFSTWTNATTVGTWLTSGTTTRTANDSEINFEQSPYCLKLDCSALAAGSTSYVQQTITVDNQRDVYLVIDYKYTNPQDASQLVLSVQDGGNGSYYNAATESWWPQPATGAYPDERIADTLPVSSTRTRYALRITPMSATDEVTSGTTTAQLGSTTLTVRLQVTSDGTTTTQQSYTLYSIAPYHVTSVEDEEDSQGERLAFFPLVDAAGFTSVVGGGGGEDMVIPVVAGRTSYTVSSNAANNDHCFPYHPALTDPGFLCTATWTNLLLGSNDFGADWTLSNATRTANAETSPLVGETSASASRLTATNTSAYIQQGSLEVPTSRSYVAGVWVKKLSSNGSFTDVTLSLISDSTVTRTFSLTTAQGWQLLPIVGSFGVSDLTSLTFRVSWGAAVANGQIAVASAYCYRSPNAASAGCLYPPVVQTPVGSTDAVTARGLKAQTSTTDTNILDKLTKRQLISVAEGLMQLTIVPVFDGGYVPNCVIFDACESSVLNRVLIDVSSNALRVRLVDNAGNTSTASLTLVTGVPASGECLWKRDTALTIRVRWLRTGQVFLSAGDYSASSSVPGSWSTSPTAMRYFRIGCDNAGANFFDGIVRDVEVIAVGAPVS
jgi:hypothetical protein